MNIEALCHIPKSNYAYAHTENELHIRLRTAKDDLSQVNIIYGIKFDWENNQKHSMKKILSDQYYDYYQYEIVQEDFRIGYYFELISEDQVLYYTEMGLMNEFNDNQAYCYYFQYPFLNPQDVHKEPSWIPDTIFYEIFVERFFNGNVCNSPDNLSTWGEDPGPKSFFGGDLAGITKKMDYLCDLGITGIYLTPVFKSPSNHKYDIVDFYEIDSFFGGKDALRDLVKRAHDSGIKIVLDAVFNHCSDKFPPFLDVVEKGKASEYYDWFLINGDQVEKDPPNYKMFGFVASMPKLNTNNSGLKKYLLNCIDYWTRELKIDGWRLDVSDEIDHEFWRDFRRLLKKINPEAIIIGENWHDSLPWLMGDQFDSIMNYSVTKLCIDYFAKKVITSKKFEQSLSNYLTRYSEQVNSALLNLLDSHDTERFLYSAGEDKSALRNAAAFLFGYQGMPCIYYGSEIGLTGNYDPGCRKTFDWNKDNWDMELYSYYKKLISIRKNEKALKYGAIEFHSTDSVFCMKRIFRGEIIYIALNTTDSRQLIEIAKPESTTATELISEQVWEHVEEKVKYEIPANTAFYIKLA